MDSEGFYQRGVLFDLFCRGVSPEAFEAIKDPCLELEDVYDHVNEVKQNPRPSLVAFDVPGAVAHLFGPFQDRIGKGLDMDIGSSCTDEEVVREIGDIMEVEYQNILRFFGLEKLNTAVEELAGLVGHWETPSGRLRIAE
jgi:hypothetical protein